MLGDFSSVLGSYWGCIISSGKKRLPTKFTIDGEDRKISNSICYLGINLGRHLTFGTHLTKKLKSVRKTYYSLRHLISSPAISLRLKLLIYQSVLRPALLNGTPLFRFLPPSTIRGLQQFQNKVIRTALWHTPYRRMKAADFHEKFELPTITEAIRRRHIKFFDSIQHCQNLP
ncbi:hypothetical protein ACUWC3_28130, partial [Klebsiella pneumoniae]|uniref:hypothetical protein n=1 Tax=Klebsiella pneumoniae TaxID=573 RepID=UPI004055738F